MPVPDLREIRTFPSLVKYLRDQLDWPIESEDFDDLTFEYTAEELGIDAKTAAKIQEIKQLRPLNASQPWGIFFVKFEPRRLPVVALRRILGRLVLRKRESANAAERKGWDKHDLLFISSFGEGEDRQISFAHFTDNDRHGDLPTLKVLGWDQEDTVRKLDHVHQELTDHLRWPGDGADVQAWRDRWAGAFTLRHREVITTSKALAVRLAELARDIRKRVNAALKVENDKGPLTTLMNAFKQALIHDLQPDDFADMYAQTIAYGLLTARVSRPAGIVADNLADMVPITNPFLKELMETFLNLGGRKWNTQKGKLTGIDFDELGVNDVVDLLRQTNMEAVLRDFDNRNPLEDPVIHFYELFLKEYDSKKRMQRGVFYTPKPVVSYIVRSVHELLQTEFGLTDGLADTTTWAQMLEKHKDLKLPLRRQKSALATDQTEETIDPATPFVQILDPATGTATFLVEVIDVIHKTMLARWKKEGRLPLEIPKLWNEYVPKHLLPRLHGYELMMAPYAIAHMKIGLKLFDTGYQFGSGERARIYLTNALEPPQDFSETFEQMAPALAHEANAVNDVKRHQRFTVVIGNPPYSNFGMMNKIPFILRLLEDYKRGLGEKKLNLDDDFIKFVRFGQKMIEEAAVGVFGFITNNTYIDGITHRQMRRSLLDTFSAVYVTDLHGSSSKKEVCPDGSKDENVFDIQQGVGISMFVAGGSSAAPSVFHTDLWGTRDAKYRTLLRSTCQDVESVSLKPHAPQYFFVPKDFSGTMEYSMWPRLTEVFTSNGPGVKTERDAVSIHWTRRELADAVSAFQTLTDGQLRQRFGLGPDSRDWKVANAKADVIKSDSPKCYTRILYRPFDMRHIWYSGQTRGFVGTPGYPVMRNMLERDAIGILAMRQFEYDVPEYCYVFVSRFLIDNRTFVSNRGIANLFPLYTHVDETRGQSSLNTNRRQLNLKPTFLENLGHALQVPSEGRDGLPRDVTAEEVFHYVYAVLHSPLYRSRYAESLKIDFPRIPLPSEITLFRILAQCGGDLVALHLLESSKFEGHITTYIGTAEPNVDKLAYSNGNVWLNKAQTCGFAGVPESVWNFYIGGYQVCEKWLKDRKGRTLSKDDIAHYQKIIVAINETIRLMKEIDEVIEKHGGWPGAFITDPAKLAELKAKPAPKP